MIAIQKHLLAKSHLQDAYGRYMRKLRISLTDACNYRCFYCMPEDTVFAKQNKWLSPEEIFGISSMLVGLGVEQIRVTGGEPCARPDFLKIMEMLGSLNCQSLGVTSNGENLKPMLLPLWSYGCRSLNISMDSLDAGRFERITKSGNLAKVLGSIYTARDMGFKVKVNCVAFKGINDGEFLDFCHWSAREKVEVRFLEFMKIGPLYKQNFNRFISAGEILEILKKEFTIEPIKVERDSTSFMYALDNGAKIGFIASESKPFCESCSRLRLSSEGVLRSCLMKEEGLNVKGLPPEEFYKALGWVIAQKPVERLESLGQSMNQIGG